MKKIMFTLFALAAALPQAIAQEADSTRATVDVDGQTLESLLTDAQKQTIRHLAITGTLAEEDYAYLRSGLLAQLDTLDLSDADIDTIPAHAFDCNIKDARPYNYAHILLLPKKLKHLSDRSLCFKGSNWIAELAGAYPTLGCNVYNYYEDYNLCKIRPTVGNNELKVERDCLYSADGGILYRSNNFNVDTIPEGVHTIYANAFENCYIHKTDIISKTVEYIGDRAFANVRMVYYTGAGWLPYLICEATVPPRLGKDVFFNQTSHGILEIYVPDESVELYRNAEGWKEFMSILGLSTPRPVGIKGAQAGASALEVQDCADGYTLSNEQLAMQGATLYNAAGQTLSTFACNLHTLEIPKHCIPSPFAILRVDYTDGTSETIKLKP